MSHLAILCDDVGPFAYDPNIQVLWSLSIEDVQAPTDVEVMNAVTLNDFNLTDIIGWEVRAEIITAPPWGAFATQRVGAQAIGTAELTFAAERATGDDIRTVLRRFDRGFILMLPSGPYLEHPNAPLNVYPVVVAQVTQRQRLREGGSQIDVQFAIRDVVGENVMVVPET